MIFLNTNYYFATAERNRKRVAQILSAHAVIYLQFQHKSTSLAAAASDPNKNTSGSLRTTN
jgi:hypothetical protein